MTLAKLFILGEERELLWTNTNYYRSTRADGSPTSDVEGGFLTLSFVSQENDHVFWHNMTKEVEEETERMTKGEVHFYKKGDEDIPIRKYKFDDAYLIAYSEVFYANGTENMHIVLTLSPAIQDYGAELVKYWNKSWIPPSEPVYYVPKQEKKETRVKTIKCVTTLDLGSANDGTRTNQQEGMLYGKSYEFKVVAFTEETPADKSIINWSFKYHSLSQNKWIEKKISPVGDTLKFTVNEKDMCGRFVYLRAYIKDAKNEGELKVWKHNRFRWFDRMVIDKETKERTDKNKPWLINQSGTSLCGMACIFYLFAKEQPESYKTFIKELFRTGEATFNDYTVKPSIEILEKKPNEKGFPYNDGYMPQVDYISLAGTRNTDNPKYKGGDEEFQAINWPPLMTDLSKKLLGYNSVHSKGCYNPIKSLVYTDFDVKIAIENINKQLKDGFKVILMIDADLIQDYWDYGSVDYHWVVLESNIATIPMLNKIGKTVYKLDFKVYSWGTENKYLERAISFSHFMNNFYGYIKMK